MDPTSLAKLLQTFQEMAKSNQDLMAAFQAGLNNGTMNAAAAADNRNESDKATPHNITGAVAVTTGDEHQSSPGHGRQCRRKTHQLPRVVGRGSRQTHGCWVTDEKILGNRICKRKKPSSISEYNAEIISKYEI